MKKRAVTLLLCLVLVVLSLLRGFAASAAGIIPATKADFDVPCAAAILIDEDSGTVLYEKNADARRPIASIGCCKSSAALSGPQMHILHFPNPRSSTS